MPHNRLILLADDSADDRFLLRRTFTKAGVLNPIREITSGSDVIAYLNGAGAYEDRASDPFPSILLLALHMRGVHGFGVLDWIRKEIPSRGLLVVVLSRLDEVKNVNRAYSLGANSFLTKPGTEAELEGLIGSFRDYWLLRNRPPEHKGSKSVQ